MFTLDTESGHRDVVLLTASYGLGARTSSRRGRPGRVLRPTVTYETGHRAVHGAGSGRRPSGWSPPGASGTRNEHPGRGPPPLLPHRRRGARAGRAAIAIEHHHGRPMDAERRTGSTARRTSSRRGPETAPRRPWSRPCAGTSSTHPARCSPAVARSVTGSRSARCGSCGGIDELTAFRPGEVLVADTTTPDWGAGDEDGFAVVTDRGGRTCHAAIVVARGSGCRRSSGPATQPPPSPTVRS